jgi:hypothetical protein
MRVFHASNCLLLFFYGFLIEQFLCECAAAKPIFSLKFVNIYFPNAIKAAPSAPHS